jgi:hypothetical protein
MADQFNAKLTILHAFQMPPPPWSGDEDASRFIALVDAAALKHQRQSELDRFLHDELQARKPECILIESDPVEVIT